MDEVSKMSEAEIKQHQTMLAKARGMTLEAYLQDYRDGKLGEFDKPLLERKTNA